MPSWSELANRELTYVPIHEMSRIYRETDPTLPHPDTAGVMSAQLKENAEPKDETGVRLGSPSSFTGTRDYDRRSSDAILLCCAIILVQRDKTRKYRYHADVTCYTLGGICLSCVCAVEQRTPFPNVSVQRGYSPSYPRTRERDR
jgi:hypothetical protein